MFEFIRQFIFSDRKKNPSESQNGQALIDAFLADEDTYPHSSNTIIDTFLNAAERAANSILCMDLDNEKIAQKKLKKEEQFKKNKARKEKEALTEKLRQKHLEKLKKLPIPNYLNQIAASCKEKDTGQSVYYLSVLNAELARIKKLSSFNDMTLDVFLHHVKNVHPEFELHEQLKQEVQSTIKFCDVNQLICKYLTTKTPINNKSITLKIAKLFPDSEQEIVFFKHKIERYKKENAWEIWNAQLHLPSNSPDQNEEIAARLILSIKKMILNTRWEVSKIKTFGGENILIDKKEIVTLPEHMAKMIELIENAKINKNNDQTSHLKTLQEILKIANTAVKKQPVSYFGLIKRDPKAHQFYQKLEDAFKKFTPQEATAQPEEACNLATCIRCRF